MRIVAAALLLAGALDAAGIRAGVARVDITPAEAIWMSGFGGRNRPSEGVEDKLFAKALAFEDARGNRAVVVTTDVVGFPASLGNAVVERVRAKHRLDRSRVLFNASHTHSGPMIEGNLQTMFVLDAEQEGRVKRYSRGLEEKLAGLVISAIGNLAPAELSVGRGTAGFAVNRRQKTPQGVRIGIQPDGPVDHEVPVLRVTAGGRVLAVLFGYACHNVTPGGRFYRISADWAGYAQTAVEEANPGATALFLQLCGGDQNPEPMNAFEHAPRHGKVLGEEVARVLGGSMAPVKGTVRTAFETVSLRFAPHTKEAFERELAASPNTAQGRRARLMLEAYERGRPVRSIRYPVQAIALGGFTIVGLGGEVVVDYGLRIKKEYPKDGVVVAGYSNDVMCYIPTVRILREGGYEAEGSMAYYAQPGRLDEIVEDTLMGAVHAVMRKVGAKRVK